MLDPLLGPLVSHLGGQKNYSTSRTKSPGLLMLTTNGDSPLPSSSPNKFSKGTIYAVAA